MSLRDRLERLLPASPPAAASRDRLESAMRGTRRRTEFADVIDGEDAGHGVFLVRRSHPLPNEFAAAEARLWAALGRDPELALARHDALAFLDLETTGLAGGTGTLPFLIGTARAHNGVLETVQYLLRDPGAEPHALARLAADLSPAAALVTFNGKCFDVPLLETRFVMNRRPWRPLPHLDLLFPARRVFRRRLESCTLGRLEAEVLGRPRDGDIDGADIPRRWFDWLALGDARPLAPVVEHNRLDLVALAALAGRLARLLDRPADASHPLDLFSIGAMLARDGDPRAEAALGEALTRGATEAGGELARVKKRRGARDEALPLWEQAARQPGKRGLEAGVELAKHYEHRAKDPVRALSVVRELLGREGLGAGERAELEKRAARLARRAGSFS